MRAQVLATGGYVPERRVTNEELAGRMDTSDAWIRQRTGIQERRHVDFASAPMGASDLALRASTQALERAGVRPDEVDCIVYATLSPDRFFPGDGVVLQAKLGVPAGVAAYDVRNQCSGFLYGLQMADAFLRSGTYRTVLLVGAEVHSTGLDFSDRGRDVAVLFGDGAGAMVLRAQDDAAPSIAGEGAQQAGVLAVHVHADGRHADALCCQDPSSATMPRLDAARLERGEHYPHMDGPLVFRNAVVRMPEALQEVLATAGKTTDELDLLICHQANLRIAEAVQKRLGLRDDQVFNNIMHLGNTTAASLPLAIDEAWQNGRLQRGQLLALASFGSGFTWGAALLRL